MARCHLAVRPGYTLIKRSSTGTKPPFFSMAEMSAPAVENHDPDSPSGRLLSFDAADLSDLGKQLGTLSIRPCARRPGASITASLQGRSTGSAWLTGSSGRSRSSLTHRRHPSTDQRGRGMRRFRTPGYALSPFPTGLFEMQWSLHAGLRPLHSWPLAMRVQTRSYSSPG